MTELDVTTNNFIIDLSSALEMVVVNYLLSLCEYL